MINLKKVELKDKTWMEPLLVTSDLSGCHQNFTNIFAWSESYKYQVAQVNDYLVVKSGHIVNEPAYFWPAGSGDVKAVLEKMKQDAVEREHDFILAGISPENMAELRSLYPDNFEYKESRDAFDYVYMLDKLISLSGNKLHSKRNHINRFKENNNWNFEPISLENLAECWEMNKAWCKANKYEEDEQLVEELCAVRRCFNNFVPLGLEGGLLRLDGRIIAFTMGEKLNSDTFVTHIEKAFGEIQGAYQMINREFAVFIKEAHPELLYVNREEDMGYEGLRKAKLSYHPVKMEEKFWARFIQ